MENRNDNRKIPVTYAAWSLDDEIRYNSTSGGLFSEIAKAVFRQHGIVYGSVYGNHCRVEYGCAHNERELVRLRQSKYVQSYTADAYREVKNNLEKGTVVLFCGTPCQVAGLYSFFQKDYPNLYTIDFICRGVNSPKAYRAWIEEIEGRHGKEAAKVWFKYKANGWKNSPRCTKIEFSDGSSIVYNQEENMFMGGIWMETYISESHVITVSLKGLLGMGILHWLIFGELSRSLMTIRAHPWCL